MIRSKSRKSLSSKLEKQQFVEEDLEPSAEFANRKQGNSWIAQSFRKAFFGSRIDSKKKLSTHKSQSQIHNPNSSRMTSSVSVNNCALASYEQKFQRNSCSDNSKRSSISDDEDQSNLMNQSNIKFFHSMKFYSVSTQTVKETSNNKCQVINLIILM